MWLGLSKIGVVGALINTNLRKEALTHSIRTASSKAIIISVDFLSALKEVIRDEELKKMKIYVYDEHEVEAVNSNQINFYRDLEKISSDSLDISEIEQKDKLFYIYTSGTTGMPKAAVITHSRFLFMTSGAYKMFDLKPDDIIYDTLPLYHTGEHF